jgi:hypothetical protein
MSRQRTDGHQTIILIKAVRGLKKGNDPAGINRAKAQKIKKQKKTPPQRQGWLSRQRNRKKNIIKFSNGVNDIKQPCKYLHLDIKSD